MRLIDLTHTIDGHSATYPGDPPLVLVQNRWMARDHYNAFQLTSSMHVGTHVDLPLHLQDHPLTAKDYPIERFAGPGRLLCCPSQGQIFPDESWEELQAGEIPVLCTGWDKHFGQNDFFSSHPTLSAEAARFLMDRGVGMIIMDIPSPDRLPFTVHKQLLAAGILLVENAAHLDELKDIKKFTVMALPLKLPTEGSLVRAVAMVED